MKKIWGILGILIVVCVFTALQADGFLRESNIENLVRRSALFGVISIGAGFVIITGGIDLSIGSMVAVAGCLTPWLIVDHGWPPAVAIGCVLAVAAGLGLAHGLLVTKLDLQPFIVTLCGLLLYRGITRALTIDRSLGFGLAFDHLRWPATEEIPLPFFKTFRIPVPCVFVLAIAVVAAVFLNHTIWGRYLLALGRNEEAARFSGIRTDRLKILAYVVCALLAGIGGLLFVFDSGSAQGATFGNFYELYAIAGAVLGGCALRGGEGSILGVLIGASLMQALQNSITLLPYVPSQVEFAVIGSVILAGMIVDEVVKRFAARKRLR